MRYRRYFRPAVYGASTKFKPGRLGPHRWVAMAVSQPRAALMWHPRRRKPRPRLISRTTESSRPMGWTSLMTSHPRIGQVISPSPPLVPLIEPTLPPSVYTTSSSTISRTIYDDPGPVHVFQPQQSVMLMWACHNPSVADGERSHRRRWSRSWSAFAASSPRTKPKRR